MPDLRLVELIDSVAEGADVNWDEVTGAARSDQERHLLDDLRTVADIAQLHRVFAAAPDGVTTPVDIGGWGDLEVVDRLGGGAFGDVYLARDARLHRLVALKLLGHSLTTRVPLAAQLLEEARILARVRHPNVVGVFGAGVHEGRAGFWMEYVAGDTLEDRLADDGPLSAEEAASVGRQVCRALAAVHNAGLIHRDVKARNIMRERGGRIVLMDFGAGIPIEQPAGSGEARVGTPMYLAPETLAGATASVQSDVYAVGVLLYHLVSGEFPYAAASIDELQRVQASGGVTPLQTVRPDLPAPLIQVVERALGPLDARYQSAGEMAAALERVIVEHPRPDVPPVSRWLSGLALAASLAFAMFLSGKPVPSPAAPTIHVDALSVVTFASSAGDPALKLLGAGLSRDVHRHLRRMHVPVRGAAPVSSPPAIQASMLRRDGPADGVLTASIARADADRLSLGVRVAAADGDVQWRGEYVVSQGELPSVGRRVAADVARAMGLPPTSDTWKPASSYPAYDAYQRGRTYAEERTEAGLLRSTAYYQEAIRLAPDYAEPWAGLADSYILRGIPAFGSLAPREARRLASDAAINALQRDAYSAEAHTSLAYIAYFHDWDWPNAESRFRQAIELEPQYVPAHHWYADYLNAMGRQGEALAEIQLAVEIDPQSLVLRRDVAWHLFFQRRYPEAIEQLRRTQARDPGLVMVQSLLGRVLSAAGEHAAALTELQAAGPHLSSRATALAFIAQAEAAAGARAAARQHLGEALRSPDADGLPPYYVALVYATLGEPEQAMTWLRRGFDTADSTMVNVDQDPRFDSLRPRADFERLLRDMRFPDAMARGDRQTAAPAAQGR